MTKGIILQNPHWETIIVGNLYIVFSSSPLLTCVLSKPFKLINPLCILNKCGYVLSLTGYQVEDLSSALRPAQDRKYG